MYVRASVLLLSRIKMRPVMPAAIYNHPRFALERECFHDFRYMLRSDMRAHINDRAAVRVDFYSSARVIIVWFPRFGTDIFPKLLVVKRFSGFGDAVFGVFIKREAKQLAGYQPEYPSFSCTHLTNPPRRQHPKNNQHSTSN